jgi:nanoRNase/pAp phosphatase (c-di-AMP/oligoRNAs hydrolase)
MSYFSDVVFKNPLFFPSKKFSYIMNFFDASMAQIVELYDYSEKGLLKEMSKALREVERNQIDFDYSFAGVDGYDNLLPIPSVQLLISSEMPEFVSSLDVIPTEKGNVGFIVDLPLSNFQYLAAEYLSNENSDFVVLVSMNTKNETLSIRSNRELAQQLSVLFSGGGHLNAAGSPVKNMTPEEVKTKIKERF